MPIVRCRLAAGAVGDGSLYCPVAEAQSLANLADALAGLVELGDSATWEG